MADKAGNLSFIEMLLQAADQNQQSVGMMPPQVPKAILKSLASMLGTYNPDSDRIEVGARPGLIDDIIGLPATVDDISAMLGHGTHLAGPMSRTASALSNASSRRRQVVAPARGKGEAFMQGVSDAAVAIPGTEPAKMGKVAKAVTAIPRAIYDTVIPVMDTSTKMGKAVAGGSAAVGGTLGALGSGDDDQGGEFFSDLRTDIDQNDNGHIDQLLAKAQAGDRASYEELKTLFPKEVE